MILLDGKKLSQKIQQNLKEKVVALEKKYNNKITLACVLVGDDDSSKIYVNNKMITSQKVGLNSILHHLPANITQTKLNNLLKKLSADDNITGILLQLPLPITLDPRLAISHISPKKDIDGLTNLNLGKLVSGEYSGLTSCTALGIVALLDEYSIDVEGKNICIIGKSLIVGKPLIELLLNKNATVSICHKLTKNLKTYTKNADIIISATGKKHLINASFIKKNSVLIDVGIIRENNKIYGDINFDSVKNKASYITPVPGGIGPLTVTMLIKNTITAFEQNLKNMNKI